MLLANIDNKWIYDKQALHDHNFFVNLMSLLKPLSMYAIQTLQFPDYLTNNDACKHGPDRLTLSCWLHIVHKFQQITLNIWTLPKLTSIHFQFHSN